jgi:hypothetical protein
VSDEAEKELEADVETDAEMDAETAGDGESGRQGGGRGRVGGQGGEDREYGQGCVRQERDGWSLGGGMVLDDGGGSATGQAVS